jgi:hypothetical protein
MMADDERVKWKMRRCPSGQCQALISIPLSERHATPQRAVMLGWGWKSIKRAAKKAYKKTRRLAIVATSPRVISALRKAAKTAAKLSQNPALAALLPPGTAQALRVALVASKAAESGDLASVMNRLKGPGAKRLAAALAKIEAQSK